MFITRANHDWIIVSLDHTLVTSWIIPFWHLFQTLTRSYEAIGVSHSERNRMVQNFSSQSPNTARDSHSLPSALGNNLLTAQPKSPKIPGAPMYGTDVFERNSPKSTVKKVSWELFLLSPQEWFRKLKTEFLVKRKASKWPIYLAWERNSNMWIK